MDSTELSRIERRVRLQYEWSRVQRALLGFAPVLLIVLAATLLTRKPRSALLFGGSMFVLGTLALWYGREIRRAVLPGLVAGLVPLTLALCANHLGHACTGDRCVALCIPACTLGGLVAALSIAALGHRGRHGVGFWIGASGIALLTGAMGCTCVGYSGLAGLALGYGLGIVPSGLQSIFGRNRRL
ncbi:MAG TPA: hypothetical protein VJR89_26470 [Polyangiales bacterium]|nr:hypothetical protein [Polyangiales bacterium]